MVQDRQSSPHTCNLKSSQGQSSFRIEHPTIQDQFNQVSSLLYFNSMFPVAYES